MNFRRFPIALAAGLLCTAWVSARPQAETVRVTTAPFAPDSGSLSIYCGTLIDGVSDQPVRDRTIAIRRGRIESITAGRATATPLLDLSKDTCLPGLIDMHTHLTDQPADVANLTVFLHRSDEQARALGHEHAQATLEAGFTAARNVGTYIAWTDRTLRDDINRGEAIGPRMQIVGYYLTIPGGGGDLLIPGIPEPDIPARVRRGVARGAAQFRDKAQAAIDGGADLLKVIASGAVLSYGGVPGQPEMTPEEIKAVVDVAHAAHKKVAAHAHGAQSIKDAILAGADTIEHASYIDDEGIALAREHHVALSMDIYNGDYTDTEGRRLHEPEEFIRKNLETTDIQRRNFTKAHAAGVALVFGTDACVYPHGWNARQFPIMVARGMTPMEAIRSATSVAAKYMGWGERIGRIAPGYLGDVIAVRGDPLRNIALLEDVRVVVKGGQLFKDN